MSQVKDYIIALTNLYGIVHKDKVVEIYNAQNEDKTSVKEVEKYLGLEELEKSFVYEEDDYFVHETIAVFDEFDLVLNQKGDKPYYIPQKEELLKYADMDYFERTKEYEALVSFVSKNFTNEDVQRADEICEDIELDCRSEIHIQAIFDNLERMKIQFKDEKQLKELTQLIMNISNNVRIWTNNGYTPNELFNKYEKPNLKPLPDKPFDFNDTNVFDFKTGNKVGRNDQCPCGSEKKYKKCCGKG